MIYIELRPEIEARLVANAQARGLEIEAYVTSLLEQAAMTTTYRPRRRTQEEVAAFYDALAAHSDKIPQLPDEAFTRESFYHD
jgi:anthranilate phosphoribosyltransferase